MYRFGRCRPLSLPREKDENSRYPVDGGRSPCDTLVENRPLVDNSRRPIGTPYKLTPRQGGPINRERQVGIVLDSERYR